MDINNFLSSFKKNEIIYFDICPSMSDIYNNFVNNQYKVIKYKHKDIINNKSKYITYDIITKKYYCIYYFTREKDLITNIKCNIDNIQLLFNNEIIKCDINDLILPLISMRYLTTEFKILLPNNFKEFEISYDVYLFNNDIRRKLYNSNVLYKNIIFNNGSFIGYKNDL
jgi:hypothetical protein